MEITKNVFMAWWCKWTGDPIHETRHRIRMCSEAGLLPERSDPMTDDDIGRALLAFLGSDTHKDAPKVVREFSEFICGAFEVGGEEIIASSNLLRAITISLRPPFSLVALSASSNGRWAELHVSRDGNPLTSRFYCFGGPALDLPRTTFPAILSRAIGSKLTGHLSDLMNGTTKAAEVAPSNGLQNKLKQAESLRQPPLTSLIHTRAPGNTGSAAACLRYFDQKGTP